MRRRRRCGTASDSRWGANPIEGQRLRGEVADDSRLPAALESSPVYLRGMHVVHDFGIARWEQGPGGWVVRTVRRLKVCDTADRMSALRGKGPWNEEIVIGWRRFSIAKATRLRGRAWPARFCWSLPGVGRYTRFIGRLTRRGWRCRGSNRSRSVTNIMWAGWELIADFATRLSKNPRLPAFPPQRRA